MSYEKEVDINNKFNSYLKVTGVINNYDQTTEDFKQKKNNIMKYTCLPALLYDSESLPIAAVDTRRITTTEMKYMRIHLDSL